MRRRRSRIEAASVEAIGAPGCRNVLGQRDGPFAKPGEGIRQALTALDAEEALRFASDIARQPAAGRRR